MKKTPEEIEALRAGSQELKAEKERKKAEKRAKYGDANFQKNFPVLEVRLPWVSAEGRDIDIERPPWDSLVDAWLAIAGKTREQVRVRVVRT